MRRRVRRRVHFRPKSWSNLGQIFSEIGRILRKNGFRKPKTKIPGSRVITDISAYFRGFSFSAGYGSRTRTRNATIPINTGTLKNFGQILDKKRAATSVNESDDSFLKGEIPMKYVMVL